MHASRSRHASFVASCPRVETAEPAARTHPGPQRASHHLFMPQAPPASTQRHKATKDAYRNSRFDIMAHVSWQGMVRHSEPPGLDRLFRLETYPAECCSARN